MKNIILLCSLFLTVSMSAQELGIMVGGGNYLGDLTNNSTAFYFQETKPAGGIFYRHYFSSMFDVKVGFNYAMISGDDDNASKESIRNRNLSFRSNVFELGVTGELNIPGFAPYNLSQTFSPYLFGGAALFYFDPTTEYAGDRVKLQPLGTEGQNSPYGKMKIAFPMGLGLKYALNENWNIGLELGGRYALTDYLDDVSGNYVSSAELLAQNGALAAELGNRSGEGGLAGTPRGDEVGHDWYFIGGITVSYNFLDTGLIGSRKRRSKKKGCRTY